MLAALYPPSKPVCLQFFQPEFKSNWWLLKWVKINIWSLFSTLFVQWTCSVVSFHTIWLYHCINVLSAQSHTSALRVYGRWFSCAVGFELWPPFPVHAHLPPFPQAWLYWHIWNISAPESPAQYITSIACHISRDIFSWLQLACLNLYGPPVHGKAENVILLPIWWHSVCQLKSQDQLSHCCSS